MSCALLLVSHGSSDGRVRLALGKLAAQVTAGLNPQEFTPWVRTAVLEPSVDNLILQTCGHALGAYHQGHRVVRVFPLFLLPGVHVKEDVPAAMAAAMAKLPPALKLEIWPHLGAHPQISTLLTKAMAQATCEGWILVAHGSNRSEGNQAVQALAASLAVQVAFWTRKPSLADQVQALEQQGCRRIGILPYVLFGGHLSHGIAALVRELQSQTCATLHLESPLGDQPGLADLILKALKLPSLP